MLSIVVTAYKREKYFGHALRSISEQVKTLQIPYEILVVNDGIEPGIKEICDKYPHLNIRYFFIGMRNALGSRWRTQMFPNNFALKEAKGDLILYHYSDIIITTKNCYRDMVDSVSGDSKVMAQPDGIMDIEENFGYRLNQGQELGIIEPKHYSQMMTEVPYCMIFHKPELMAIGGWDEDFTGYLWEDTDLMERLKANGCRLKILENHLVIHLWHQKGWKGREGMNQEAYYDGINHNQKLLDERRGIIVRNKDRSWGEL